MLVLSRKEDESIIINDNIEIKVIGIKQDQVKIGIVAPRDVKIFRKEIYEQIQRENIAAASAAGQIEQLKEALSKKDKSEGKHDQ